MNAIPAALVAISLFAPTAASARVPERGDHPRAAAHGRRLAPRGDERPVHPRRPAPSAVPVAAAPSEDRFGAIARSPSTGQIGWSYGYATLADAQVGAVQACGTDCLIVTWERNQCAVLAAGTGLWATASAPTVDEAERAAQALCAQSGVGDCVVVRWVCS